MEEREKYFFFRGEGKKCFFLEEKEKECNIWRRNNYFFAEEKKNGEGKGEKYLEKENQKGHYLMGPTNILLLHRVLIPTPLSS